MGRNRWCLVAWIGAALAAPVQATDLVEAEFLETASGLVLVRTAKGSEVIALEPGATLVGMSSPGALQPGDRVRYAPAGTEGGVRLATSLEVLPSVTTDPEHGLDLGRLLELLAPRGEGQGAATLLDLRSEDAFARGHLPGAISAATWKKRLAAILPKDQDVPLVLYGQSRQDAASVEALRAVLRLGRAKVRFYAGGYREWSDDNRPTLLRPRDLARRLGSEPLVVLDVRPEADWAGGSLPRSVSIVPSAMQPADWMRRPEMPTLVLVGRDGDDRVPYEVAEKIRVWQPSADSIPSGTIQILEGGFAAWIAEGRPLEPPRRSLADVPCIPLEGEVCADEFLRLWKKGDFPGAPLLLDVRTGPSEYRPPWARHLPMGELRRRLSELPRDREIVVFCGRGITSRVAQGVLARAGFKARFLRLPAPRHP